MLERQWRAQCAELAAARHAASATPAEPSPSTSSCRARPAPPARRRSRALQNIPVLSWLLLSGRCAGCGHASSPRYPLVEAAHRHRSRRRGLEVRLRLARARRAGAHLVPGRAHVHRHRHQLLPDSLTLPLLWLGLLRQPAGARPRAAARCRWTCARASSARSPAISSLWTRLPPVQAAHRQGRHGLRRLQAARRARRLARLADAAADHPDRRGGRRGGRHRHPVRCRSRAARPRSRSGRTSRPPAG